MHHYLKRPRVVEASWPVVDLCRHYQWPTDAPGGGVIAIVELGGGWTHGDVAMFCQQNGVEMPSIMDISVDGTTNNKPGVDPDSDGEVALDIQVAAASYFAATGKPAMIRVYWGTDIAPCVTMAAEQGCDVCSISWGEDEAQWGKEGLEAMEAAALSAVNDHQMVIFAASGDNDSNDGGPNPANVDAPASCPHVIGCGGTRFPRSGQVETVWNDSPGNTDGEGTGGGFSTEWPMSQWMASAPHGPGRMVPDVAANADPETGYEVILDGKVEVSGGTSAVAPLYAGLFAAFGRKLGAIQGTLWSHPLAFNDITEGNNGQYRAARGPDPCTGLGTPIGAKLAAEFAK